MHISQASGLTINQAFGPEMSVHCQYMSVLSVLVHARHIDFTLFIRLHKYILGENACHSSIVANHHWHVHVIRPIKTLQWTPAIPCLPPYLVP
jgi:hypothetical protein